MPVVRRAVLRTLCATTLTLLVLTPHASAQTNPFQDIPVAGTFTGGSFAGTLDITRFTARGGVIYAVGTLSGTIFDAAGAVLGTVTDVVVALPVTSTAGSSCQILHLELGPLDLDLLGLQVRLNRVVLDITAQQGPGNLLGNLLCALAGLLDSNGTLRAITQLLNQILALFA